MILGRLLIKLAERLVYCDHRKKLFGFGKSLYISLEVAYVVGTNTRTNVHRL